MLPETVVCQTERVSFGEQVAPGESGIQIRIPVRNVGQSFLVCDAFLQGASGDIPFIVARINVVVRSSHVEPVREIVAQADGISFGLHVSVVLVDSELCRAVFSESALDVIFGVPVNVAGFRIETVFPERMSVTQIEIQVVTVLRAEVRLAGFQVFVTEEFVGSGQAVGFLIRYLGLQFFIDIICTCGSISPGAYGLFHVLIVAHAVAAG